MAAKVRRKLLRKHMTRSTDCQRSSEALVQLEILQTFESKGRREKSRSSKTDSSDQEQTPSDSSTSDEGSVEQVAPSHKR